MDIKLHVPHNTTVEVILKNGEVISVKVIPEERENDVVLAEFKQYQTRR